MTLNPKLDPTCVLCLPWGEPSGNTAYDQSQYGNNGTIYGAVRTNGKPRWALSFDGVDDYAVVPDNPSFDSKSVTVTAWVYALPGAFGTSTSARPSGVVCKKYRLASPRDVQFSLQGPWRNDGYGPNLGGYYGRALFQVWSGSYSYTIGDDELTPTGRWVFLAGVASGAAEEIRFYRDGVLRNSYTVPGMDLVFNNAPLYVGFDGWSTHFPGLIGEARVYNRALSGKEIYELYVYGIEKLRSYPPPEYRRQLRRRLWGF
jgi:hypothetical protein